MTLFTQSNRPYLYWIMFHIHRKATGVDIATFSIVGTRVEDANMMEEAFSELPANERIWFMTNSPCQDIAVGASVELRMCMLFFKEFRESLPS